MIRRILLSALLVVVLSCQNETTAPSAPQESTGTLALRVVSAKALTPVESVLVRLTWASGSKEMRRHWRDSSLQITGLPRKEVISVHMEGWSWVQGRRVVAWSGDTTSSLESSNADWNVATNTAVIRIASVAPPSLGAILPKGDSVVGGVLAVTLATSRTDTILLDTTGVDTVFLGKKELSRRDNKFILVVTADTKDTVLVVGHQGQTSWFRVVGSAKPLSRDSLVTKPRLASWSHDTLSFEHADNASDTIWIDAAGVEKVVAAGSPLQSAGGRYRVVVSKTGVVTVVVTGKAGQELIFHVVATAAARIENKRGLVARLLSPASIVVGKVCPLRVRIDSGDVTSVVLLKGDGIPFEPGADSVWSLDWKTVGESDSLEIHVYGKGQGGSPDTIRIGKKLSFDRTAPSIVLPVKSLLVGRSGGSISWTISDPRGIDSVWFEALAGNPCKDSVSTKACHADNVKDTFTIHARDALGNDTQATVMVEMDSVAPRIDTVAIVGGKSLRSSGDTIKVESGDLALIRWKGRDASIGYDVLLKKNDASDPIVKSRARTGGWDTAKVGGGIWTLTARDSFGNMATWYSFVVFEKPVIPVDTTKELAMELVPLPKWVGRTVEVKLRRIAGRVDSIVWSGQAFATKDSTVWSATWTPDTNATSDSLKIKVYGHTSNGPKVVDLGQSVNIDRKGPMIRFVLPWGCIHDTLFVKVVARDSLRILATDTNAIDSVWLTGTAATLNPSGGGVLTARMSKAGDLMAYARDTLGNEDSLHVHVVFMTSAYDTTGPSLDSVVGARGKLNGTNIPRKDSAGTVGLKIYSSEPKFHVKLWNGSDTICRASAKGGVASIDTIPMKYTGNVNLGIFDSLGNLGYWANYVVLPFVAAPVFEDADGIYGAERIKIEGAGDGVDKFTTNITCQQGTQLIRVPNGGGQIEVFIPAYYESGSYRYLCRDKDNTSARSDTVEHKITLLQRPSFVTTVVYFKGSDTVYVSMTGGNDTITGAQLQYCLGDSTVCSAPNASWRNTTSEGTSRFFVISSTTTVGIRVAAGSKVSHARYRDYEKMPLTDPKVYPRGGIMDYINVYNFNADGNLVVKLQCDSADGNSFVRWRDSGASAWTTHNVRKDSVEISKSKAMQFGCAVGPDTSTTVNYNYRLLRSPNVMPLDQSFTDSLEITASLADSTFTSAETFFQYCFTDTPPKEAYDPCGGGYTYWQNFTGNKLMIRETGTVYVRVEGPNYKRSIPTRRTYTKQQ